MPGMTSGVGTGNTLIAEAFRSALSGTAALAFGPKGSVDALAAGGSRLTVWRLARGLASWRQVQVLHVPVAYGSSG